MTAQADDPFDSFDETISAMNDEEFNNLEHEVSFNLNVDLPDDSNIPVNIGQIDAGRFASISKADVDKIASLRQEKSTIKQTKWGVKILKVNFIIQTFIYVSLKRIYCL